MLCRDKKYFCRDKSFVVTSILLSLQKMCFVATNTCCVCRDKSFVATKIMLVAGPVNDMSEDNMLAPASLLNACTKGLQHVTVTHSSGAV